MIRSVGSDHPRDGPLNSLASGGTTPEKPIDIVVRPSTDDDVAAMLALYAHHAQRGLGEFDFEPLHGDDIKRRRKNMAKHRLPHLVAEQECTVIGYAYAVLFRKRPAYRLRGEALHLRAPGSSQCRRWPASVAGADRRLHRCRLSPDDRLYRCRQHTIAAPA